MKNVVLYASIETVRALATPQRLRAFFNVLESFPAPLIPQRYGLDEPVRETYHPKEALERLSCLCRDRLGGSASFHYKGALRGTLIFSGLRGKTVVANRIVLRLDYGRVVNSLTSAQVSSALLEFVKVSDAVYACATVSGGDPFVIHADAAKNRGEINGIQIPSWMPGGIPYLCGINWINIFGPEYVEFFGRDVLSRQPAYRAEFLEGGRWFWLQPTERAEEMWTPDGRALSERIQRDLGKPNAFCDFSLDPTGMFKKYDIPNFDYREIRGV